MVPRNTCRPPSTDNPNGFVAKARLSETVGAGVGPVFVDCGREAGVTLLVTRPPAATS
ncbi:hypothetical protein MOQ72_14675 [Saccharopolyspora sp. K220]|nr:hypothetical protein [Saccharopolyspora soli]